MECYAVALKHRYAKEWDLDRIDTMIIFASKETAIKHLQDTNAKTIAEKGEETHEVVKITVNQEDSSMNQTNNIIKEELGNIVATYWVSSWIEVCVQEFDVEFRGGGSVKRRNFVVINTASDVAEDISEYAAMAMCITPDSTITVENWEDFCTGRGIFTEDI